MKRAAFPPDPVIGDRIRLAMAYHGWTQVRLARACGVTQPSVSQWISRDVTRRVTPLEKTARRIAEVLGEDVDWLMNRSDRGTQGLSKVMGEWLTALGPQVHLLKDVTPEQFLEALALVRQRRPRPARPRRRR